MLEKINFEGFENCLRISNGTAEIIVTTAVGPRIVFYGLAGGENILGLHPHAEVETALGRWKPYGGHRLWIAPENMPNSYAPDNDAVEYEISGDFAVRLIQPLEPVTNTQKEIEITLNEQGSGARIKHKITNRGAENIELSAWALTIMRGGGEAIVPNEKFEPYGAETLLPVRNLTLWSYTDFTDPRWTFEKNAIRLRSDEGLHNPQKFGVLNRQGFVEYVWSDLKFTKKFEYADGAVYPDMNSNTEIYTAGSFIEVETLSPLKSLAPGEAVEHHEYWELARVSGE